MPSKKSLILLFATFIAVLGFLASIGPAFAASNEETTQSLNVNDGRNHFFLFTNNNSFMSSNSTSVFELKAQSLQFRTMARTGGIGNGSGEYYGLDQIAMFQDDRENCEFVVDDRSNDIAAFRVHLPGLTRAGRYTDPYGSGNITGIGLAVSGRYLFAAYSDTWNIGVWKIHRGCSLRLLGTYNAAGSISGMRATPDGKTLIVDYVWLHGPDTVDSFSICPDGKLTEHGPYVASGVPMTVEITKDSRYVIFGNGTWSMTQVEIYPFQCDGSLGDETVFGGDGSLGPGINSANLWLSPDEKFLFISNNSSQQVTSVSFQESPLELSYISITTLKNVPWVLDGIITVLPYGNGGFVFVAENSDPYSQIGMLKVNRDGSTTEVSGSPFVIPTDEGGGYGLQYLAVLPVRPF